MNEPSVKWLGVHVVAKRLNKCAETVRRYIRTGLLPAVRPSTKIRGGNYLISEDDVEKFLLRHTTSSDSQPGSPQ